MTQRTMAKNRFLEILLLTAAIAVSFSLSGCRESSIVGDITLVGEADPEAAPHRIDLGDTARSSVTISNTGTERLVVRRLTYTNPDSFSITLQELPGELAPGESTRLDLTFHPAEPGIYETAVEVYIVGRDLPVKVIITAVK